MSRPLYQVHYPKIGKVTIKINNVIMKYNHNDIVEEQSFFVKYPHIFKARPDLDDIPVAVATPKEKKLEEEEEFVPVEINKPSTPKPIEDIQEPEPVDPVEPPVHEELKEEIPIPTPTPKSEVEGLNEIPIEDLSKEIEELDLDKEPEYTIEQAGKGWYRVLDENGDQVFPKDKSKKCRKKAAEKFISNERDEQ